MTRTRDVQVFDRDDEIQVGFGRALGLSNEKLAEITGLSRSAVHAVTHLEKVQRLETLARTVCAQSEARTVEKVKQGAKERMTLVFDKAFQLTERLLAKAEAKGDENTVAELMAIHVNITAWAAKYQLSEAPKRLSHEGSIQHDHVHTIALSEAANILRTRQELASAFEKPSESVIDVQPSN